MIKSEFYIGKAIRTSSNKVGIVVDGFKMETKDTPIDSVLKVMYPDNKVEFIIIDDRDNGAAHEVVNV